MSSSTGTAGAAPATATSASGPPTAGGASKSNSPRSRFGDLGEALAERVETDEPRMHLADPCCERADLVLDRLAGQQHRLALGSQLQRPALDLGELLALDRGRTDEGASTKAEDE
jgi:hypothetical protein